MDEERTPISWWRQGLAGVACMATAAAGIALWYWLKVQSLEMWSEISIFIMPLVIGAAVGWVARRCSQAGTFGIASFAAAITILAGFAGTALQEKITVNRRLQRVVEAVYKETIEYAKNTVPLEDDLALGLAMSLKEVSIIGRLAAGETTDPALDYWQKRNLIHVNWIMARNHVTYGQGGVDASIFEPTRIVKDTYFVDDLIRKLAREPMRVAEVARFREKELPYLKKLLDNRISRVEFETALTDLVRSRIEWGSLAFHGFGPFLGIFTLFGAITAYRLAREYSLAEQI